MQWISSSLDQRALSLTVLLLAATSAGAQETRVVSGVVADSGGRTVAYVTLDGGPKYRTVTNAVGEFRFSLPTNVGLEISVRRIGFLPTKVRVEPGADTTIRVTIEQLAVLMTTQIVRAQQQIRTLETRGFYLRLQDQERGALVGEFITPEEIEMRNPQRVSQLLEQRRGIQVRRANSCQVITTCYRVFGPGGCAATVYLDNQRLNRIDGGDVPAIDELIPVSGVSAIEVYPRGSSAPPRFQPLSGTCAIVVIWTR